MSLIISSRRVFGLRFACANTREVVDHLLSIKSENRTATVATANVAHIAELTKTSALLRPYTQAAIITADGFPVYLWCRLRGVPLPGRVTGQDLLATLLNEPQVRHSRICIIASNPTVAVALSDRLSSNGFVDFLVLTAPMLKSGDDDDAKTLASQITMFGPSILILGFGFPKSEIFAAAFKTGASITLSVGSAVDVWSGLVRRAPLTLQAAGLEWLWRLLSEPKRLARRYLWDSRYFFRALWLDWRADSSTQS